MTTNDEPKYTLEARDRFMPDVLSSLADLLEGRGIQPDRVAQLRKTRLDAIEWQRRNGCGDLD